ncbi:uncharacterized protein LOC131668294 [Phymastichus coffea]|uniref:uncharacterized protein LOC131668294 n=1 Tax=Phymastichus coffea TaxID=108790 RepID=UPI00273C64B0|nr:uncharacterized protein LOC131668294 [Phymastichus coffea]
MQLESLFACQQINTDLQRYHATVAGLDGETVADLMDVLRLPPAAGKYENLKRQVLARHGDTTQQRLHKLLSGLTIGDRTLAQLLRHMRALAGDSITDDALRIRWLDLLPSATSRMLRLLRKADLDELAQTADELVDTVPDICAVRATRAATSTVAAPTVASDSAALESIRAELTAQRGILEDIRNAMRSARPRDRSRSRPRNQSTGRGDLCFYHARFGESAENCRPPCGYVANTQPGNR